MHAQGLGGERVAGAGVDDGAGQARRLGVRPGAKAGARPQRLPGSPERALERRPLDRRELREPVRGVAATDGDPRPRHRQAHLVRVAARRADAREAARRVVEPAHVERPLDLLEGLRPSRLRRRRRGRRGMDRAVERCVHLFLRHDRPVPEPEHRGAQRAGPAARALDQVRAQRLGQRRHRAADQLVGRVRARAGARRTPPARRTPSWPPRCAGRRPRAARRPRRPCAARERPPRRSARRRRR